MTDTVIVNGNDLIWKDASLPRQRRMEPFTLNPIDYLNDLIEQGWRVIIYFLFNYEEYRKFPTIEETRNIYLHFQQLLSDQLNKQAEFIIYDEINFDELSPASFIILDDERIFNQNIARYTPIEIFGVNPIPEPIPDVNYILINNYRPRTGEIFMRINRYTVSLNYHERHDLILHVMKWDPGHQFVEVYSPIYKYPQNVNIDDIKEGIYEPNNYYDDNGNLIPVTFYECGY